jgi:hypothetical protein
MQTFVKLIAGGMVFIMVFLVSSAFLAPKKPQSRREIQAQIEQEVARLKPTLPQQVHPMVTWIDVEAEPQTIIYKYKVHASRDAILSKRADMEQELKHGWAGWAAKMTLPEGVSMKCEIFDENRSYLFTIEIE